MPELFGKLSRDQLRAVGDKTQFVGVGGYQWSGEFKAAAKAGTIAREGEQIIAQEGDSPNGVYVVRSGFVRMSVKFGNGRRTLSYLGAGRYFGFDEVAHNWRHHEAPVGIQHTYTAAGYTHLMFIPSINPVTCIGCTLCAKQCPYDAIRMVQIRDEHGQLRTDESKPVLRATKCDLCVENHGGPACQRACPHGALVRINMHDFDALADWLKR